MSFGPELDPGNVGSPTPDAWVPPQQLQQQIVPLIEPPSWNPSGPTLDPGFTNVPMIEPPGWLTQQYEQATAGTPYELILDAPLDLARETANRTDFQQAQQEAQRNYEGNLAARDTPPSALELGYKPIEWIYGPNGEVRGRRGNAIGEIPDDTGELLNQATASASARRFWAGPANVAGAVGEANEALTKSWRQIGGSLITAGTPQNDIVNQAVRDKLRAEGFDVSELDDPNATPDISEALRRAAEIRSEFDQKIFEEGARLEPGAGFLFDVANPAYMVLPGVAKLATVPLKAAGIPGAALIESALANAGIPYIEKLIGLPFKAAAKVIPAVFEGTAALMSNKAVKAFLAEDVGVVGRGMPENLNAETLSQRIGVPNTLPQQQANAELQRAIRAREAAAVLDQQIVSKPSFQNWLNETAGEATVNAALAGVPEAVARLVTRVQRVLDDMAARGDQELVARYIADSEKVAQHFSDLDARAMQTDPGFLANRLEGIRNLSDQDIEHGVRWYYDAMDFLHAAATRHTDDVLRGVPEQDAAARVIDAAAIMSPRADWENANKPAIDSLMRWMAENADAVKPPTRLATPDGKGIAVFPDRIELAWKRLKGDPFESLVNVDGEAQKVVNFRENLGGDATKWTSDTHDMRNAAGVSNISNPSGALYGDVANSGIIAAIRNGANPRELQAMLWVNVKRNMPRSSEGMLDDYARETGNHVGALLDNYQSMPAREREGWLRNVADDIGTTWPAVRAEFERLIGTPKKPGAYTTPTTLAAAAPVAAMGADENDPNAGLKGGVAAAAIIAALTRGKIKPIIGRANAEQKGLMNQLAKALNHKDVGALARSLERFDNGEPVSKPAFEAFSHMPDDVRAMVKKIGGGNIVAAGAGVASVAGDDEDSGMFGVLAVGALLSHQKGPALNQINKTAYNLLRKGIANHAAAGENAAQIAAHYQTSLEKVLNAAGVPPTPDRARHLVDLLLSGPGAGGPPATALPTVPGTVPVGTAAPPAVLEREGLLGSIWGAMKSLKSSLDLSGTLRQGIKLLPSHPIVAAGAFRDSLKAFKDPSYAATVVDALKQSPDHARFVENWGLYIADPNAASRALREEAFPTKVAGAIPLVNRSEAAYVTFLNLLRWNTMDSITRGHESGFVSRFHGGPGTALSDDAGKAIARMVNVNSGRGYLGKAEPAAVALNNVFFSPRYMVSTPEAMIDPLRALKEGQPAAAYESAKTMVTFLAAGFATLKLAEGAGAEVEWADPTSSDFMKIKIGDTRYDIWGGTAQAITFLTRMSTALMSEDSPVGNVPDDWAHAPKDYGETIYNFFKSKAHPGFATLADTAAVIRGGGEAKNEFDKTFGLVDVIGGAVVPMTPDAIIEAILDVMDEERSAGQAALDSGLSTLGIGVRNQPEGETTGTYTRLMDRVIGGSTANAAPVAPSGTSAPGRRSKYSR